MRRGWVTLDLARLVRPWVAVLILVLVGASCRSSEPETAGGADPGVGSAVDRAPAPTVERGDDGVPDGTYEWSTLPIGGGGWVTGISLHPTDPDAVYVRTDVAGAYRYVAGENRWEQMIHASSVSTAISSGDYAVESIAAAPSDSQTVYLSVGDDPVEGTEAGEGTGRVLSSTDGGTTWSASNKRWVVAGNGFQRQRSERLAVDPKDSLHVLLGTRREGLWQSTDGGVTWAVVDGLPRGSDDAGVGVTFVVWGTGTLDGVVWAGVAGQGVYQSENDGASWRRIRTVDADVGPFEGVVVDGRLLVAFNRLFDTGAGSLELFDAHARVWTDISPLHDRPAWSAAAVPQKPSSLVASDSAVREGHLWWSSDGGATWTSVDIGVEAVDVPWLGDSDIDSWMSIGRLAFDPHEEGRLWFAEGMGVWTAPEVIGEGSVTWQERSRGLELTVAADLVAPPNGVPLSAVADRQGFRHEDPAYYPLSTLVDDRFGGGTSLDYSAGHPEAVVWVGADYTSPDDSRTSRGAISSDGGDTWREFESLDRSQFGGNVAVSATDPDNIVWVPSHASVEEGDRPGAVFISTDGGRSWTETEGVSRTSRYHRLVWWLSRRALASDRVDGGVFYLVDDEGRFAVSADGGRTWDQAAEGPPCSQANDCHVVGQLRAAPDRAGEIWSSVGSDGLFRTSDRGASEWEQVPGVVEARAFDFGAPLPGSTEPVVYLYGRVGDDPDLAVWRSSDRGVTWAMIARHPQGLARLVNVVSGDLSRPGRVYIGFAGLGFVYGDDPSLSTE